MKVLRHLGAETRLSQIGIHPETFTSRKWDTGEVLFELALGDVGVKKYGASYITVHRNDLHAAILEKAGPETIEFGKRLTGVGSDGVFAQLSFADGSTADAGLVIQCRRREFQDSRGGGRPLCVAFRRCGRPPGDLSIEVARRARVAQLHQMVGAK